MNVTRRLPVLTASAFVGASLALAGCSPSPAADPASSSGASSTNPGSSREPSTTASAPAADSSTVLAAIALAEEDAAGTAFEIDRDEDSWQVDVAVGDRIVQVDVALDGASVLSSDDDDDDSLDDDDRAGLDAATVGVGDAITTALGEVDGTVDDVDLDSDDGDFAWDISIDDGAQSDDTTVRVGVDGAVRGVDRD